MSKIDPSVPADSENEKQIQGRNSRPFDVHRWTDYPELNNCLTDLIAELDLAAERTRKRSLRAAKRFRDAVRCLVLDLYVAWCTDPSLSIGVPRGRKHFLKKSRYSTLFLTYDHFISAFNGLEQLGYLEVAQAGFNDPRTGKGFVSRVRATPKLIDMLVKRGELSVASIVTRSDNYAPECIILRDENKRAIEYQSSKLTKRMQADLKSINSTLEQHWIDLDLSDQDFMQLQTKSLAMAAKDSDRRKPVDFTAKRLVRVFNNGSWDDGGRFYGGWWQSIPRDKRRHITINGKRTVEVDYSGMHVQMLYAKVGAKLEGDAYTIPGLTVPRDLVKTAFNKLLNAEDRIDVDKHFDGNKAGMLWQEFLHRITEHHRPISKYIRSGYGVKLQRQDADIANAVMLRFLSNGYVCLPVHDSFLVHHALKDELEEIMVAEFEKHHGVKIGLKSKQGIEQAIGDDKPIDPTKALLEMASLEGSHKDYNRRMREWYGRKYRVDG